MKETIEKAAPWKWALTCDQLEKCCLAQAKQDGRLHRCLQLLGKGRLEYFSLNRRGRRDELQKFAKMRWDEGTAQYADKVNVFGVHLCDDCEYLIWAEDERKRRDVRKLELATDHKGVYIEPRTLHQKDAFKLTECMRWWEEFVQSTGEWHPDKVHVTIPDCTDEDFWRQFIQEKAVLDGDGSQKWNKSFATFKFAKRKLESVKKVRLVKQSCSPWGHKCAECKDINKAIFSCKAGDVTQLKAIHQKRDEHWAEVRFERGVLQEHRKLASNPANRALALDLDRMVNISFYECAVNISCWLYRTNKNQIFPERMAGEHITMETTSMDLLGPA